MRRGLFLLLLVICVTALCAREQVITFSQNGETIKVVDSSLQRLVIDYSIKELQLSETANFTQLSIDGFGGNNDVGRPELPYLGSLITVPIGATVRANFLSTKVENISLKERGFTHPIYPAQPSYSKSQNMSLVTFQHDLASYQKADYQSDYSPFTFAEVGFSRGYRIFEVVFTPVQYNPVDNSIKIYSQLTVELDFLNADLYETEYQRERTWSADFEAVYEGMLLNYDPPRTRDTLMRTPTKYIIICYPSFETAMQPFVEWKRKSGFEVTLVTTATTGTSSANIKTYMQNLWNSSSPTPTYLLIVGDTGQIPAFANSMGSDPHVSDLSYVRLQGTDYLPEMYFGRFSANNLTELQPYIDKTLMYEKYTMPDPTYLRNSLLIAGVDNSYATRYCNSLVNYLLNQYFNSNSQNHTYNTPNSYLHPSSGNQATTIRNQFSNGVGWANYSAHGDTDRWYEPSFTNSNVNSLSNSGKYPIAIGNACLTNAFDTQTSFSEAMLRAANKGAVIYIGGTNYTYWNEDWCWAAGNKSAPSNGSAVSYSSSSLGMYDKLFHTHNENTSDWNVSVGAMVYVGNAVVQSISSSFKSYYWEIYGIMGDPSLIPYLGLPSANSAQYPTQITTSQNSISISNAGAFARIAISRNGELAGAVIADASGSATLSFTPFSNNGTADLVITAQNKQPLITTIAVGNGVTSGLIISPASIDFGSINVNQTSATQTFTVTNVGNSSVSVSAIAIAGTNASDYNLSVTGLPWTLNGSGSNTFTVSFTPLTQGAKVANISITTTATGSPYTVYLSGTGVVPTPGNSLPYTQNFNSGTILSNINWTGNNLTSYSGIKANSGVGGSNALALNVDGSNNSQSAYSPTLSGITSSATLSFAYRIVNYTNNWGGSLTGTALTGNNRVYIEVSSSGGTGTYTTLHEISSANHITSTSFATVDLPLSAYVGQSINVQFRANRASGDWYLVVDDIDMSAPALPTVPYTQNFNSGTNLAAIGWGGAIGQYSGIFSGSGVGDSNGLALNVYTSTAQYAYTPTITGVSGSTTLTFAYRIVNYPTSNNWSGIETAYTLVGNDKVFIEVSTTGATGAYTVLREINSGNQTVSANFATLSLPLAAYANQNINVLFRATRASGDWDLVIDDVVIEGSVATAPPQNLTATIGYNTVSLGWSAPATVQGYKVYRDGVAITGTISALTYQDNTAQNGQAYQYSVTALYQNPTGESAPATISVQLKVFNAPNNLSVTNGDRQVTLNWLSPTTHTNLATLSGFKVYRDATLLPSGTITNPSTLSFTDNTVQNGTTYVYTVVATYSNPVGDSSPSNAIYATPLTDYNDVIVPTVTTLNGNYPNPFNPETVIRFAIAKEDAVKIDIYSVNGQLVKSLINGFYGIGVYNAVWNGRDNNGRQVGSGVYFYRMTTSGYTAVKKMVLLK